MPRDYTKEDVIKEFLHHSPFERNYKRWTEDTLDSFCKLMLIASQMGLDIFTTKMPSGDSIRIGRKDTKDTKSRRLFATFEPQANQVICRVGKNDVALTSDSLEKIRKSNDMQIFAQEHPIERDAYWPSDYINTTAKINTRIWKMSHSPNSFNSQDLNWRIEHQMLVVHKNTGNGSAENFRKMAIGDIVSLGHGNTVFRLVRVMSVVKHVRDSLFEEEWLMRDYEVIKSLDSPVKYDGVIKRWSPSFNGTCWEVPKNEFSMFETEILKPYYGLTLEDLGFNTAAISESANKKASEEIMKTLPLNQILYGPPGTGKTYYSIQAAVKAAEPERYSELNINESRGTTTQQREQIAKLYKELFSTGRIKFVTFHQSYGYEEFVEGLSASAEGNQLAYFVKDGIFKTICEQAKAFRLKDTASVQSESGTKISVTATGVTSESQNFVLIIDEINRGNISKIFGELITLIEPSKRLGQPEALKVFLPYSGEAFSVPDNLYIIGTMNTADRSLALMDTALRRRFDFVEMMPDYNVLHDDNNTPYCILKDELEINLVKLLQTLNNRITALYDREHSLGHAFLMPVVDAIKKNEHSQAMLELAKCFQNKIIPLLAEYFFEDWQKIRLVLGDNQKEQRRLDQLIQRTVIEFDNLFGDTDELELMEDIEHDYRVIPADSPLWLKPQTYVEMYDLSLVSG